MKIHTLATASQVAGGLSHLQKESHRLSQNQGQTHRHSPDLLQKAKLFILECPVLIFLGSLAHSLLSILEHSPTANQPRMLLKVHPHAASAPLPITLIHLLFSSHTQHSPHVLILFLELFPLLGITFPSLTGKLAFGFEYGL